MELIVEIVQRLINALAASGRFRGGLHHVRQIDQSLDVVRVFGFCRELLGMRIEQVAASGDSEQHE
ncbi:MAG: hypothetical protein HP497_08750 [Nitrospira sp.]|nr:hypothetical protein [Nitrospira sp.]